MPTHHIVLTEEDIERIINGEEVAFDFNRTIKAGEKIIVRQSYVKDITVPIVNRDRKVYSDNQINNIKYSLNKFNLDLQPTRPKQFVGYAQIGGPSLKKSIRG